MEIKSQKGFLRKIWKNESLKNNCLNKVYKIEKGAEWDFKNEIFEGENKANSSDPKLKQSFFNVSCTYQWLSSC